MPLNQTSSIFQTSDFYETETTIEIVRKDVRTPSENYFRSITFDFKPIQQTELGAKNNLLYICWNTSAY